MPALRSSLALLLRGCAALLGAFAPAAAQGPQPDDCVVHEDLRYSEAAREPRRNRLDLYVPRRGDATPPVVVFLHGGTWTGGDKEGFARMGRTLAKHGVACAVANMRLFPFGKPEQMVDDAAAALRFVHERADEFGVDGQRLFVMGHSSGGHLAASVALDQQKLAAAGVPREALRGAILLSGVYDVRPRHPALDGVFRGPAERRRALSPMLQADAGDPPVFLVWADGDLGGLGLSARALRDRLRHAGVGCEAHELAQRNHVDFLFELMGGHSDLLAPLLRFVRDDGEVAAAAAVAAQPPPALLWLVGDEAQGTIATRAAAALATAGVTVHVVPLHEPTGEAAAAAFRAARRAAAAAGEAAPTFLCGLGACAEAALGAALDRAHDGLRGRIVVGAFADGQGRALQPLTRGAKAPSLLVLQGDREPVAMRQAGALTAVALQQRGVAADAVVLPGVTGVDALAALTDDDDLLLPLLLAFLRP